MKIKVQMGMVLNLDKCLGCHTCSIPCKNAWTTAKGSEYMWFNNVETKPGIGYPKEWENQDKYRGGWELRDGKLGLKSGGKGTILANIFANPNLPEMKDYYEPWNYDYKNLTFSPSLKNQPTAVAISEITQERIEPDWGSNWEDDLGGAPFTAKNDQNFKNMEAKMYLQYKNVFMMHLPRLCEHCLNPACVASCPSGALYKRDEDGIVLVDQTRCRSWRECVSGCPYKKVYFNWKTHHSEKCLFCFPRIEAGLPTLCAHSCVGRIRYIGVMLYDADKVHDLASTKDEKGLLDAQRGIFLDPFDEEVIKEATKQGIPWHTLEAAKNSPIRKFILDWEVALPLHPEFRTLPMVWYIPPASPLLSEGVETKIGLDKLRIPIKYLSNLLSAGDEAPVRKALGRLLAIREAMRDIHFGSEQMPSLEQILSYEDPKGVLKNVGLTIEQAYSMYRLLSLARYDERFVIPTAARENYDDVHKLKGESGFEKTFNIKGVR